MATYGLEIVMNFAGCMGAALASTERRWGGPLASLRLRGFAFGGYCQIVPAGCVDFLVKRLSNGWLLKPVDGGGGLSIVVDR